MLKGLVLMVHITSDQDVVVKLVYESHRVPHPPADKAAEKEWVGDPHHFKPCSPVKNLSEKMAKSGVITMVG